MTTYLSIDLGDKRTGLALGDDETSIVTPLEVVQTPRGAALLERLGKFIEELEPDALVVGLPYNMDGTEGPRALDARAFGAELGARFDLPVHFQDERLTSFDAEQQLARSGKTHGQKKKTLDALAAAVILREFLGSH